jgi:hypothetical protein
VGECLGAWDALALTATSSLKVKVKVSFVIRMYEIPCQGLGNGQHHIGPPCLAEVSVVAGSGLRGQRTGRCRSIRDKAGQRQGGALKCVYCSTT